MKDALDTLNNLIPVIAVLSMATFMTLERWMPYFEHGVSRGRQRWRNLGIIAIGFAMNAVMGSVWVVPVMWADAHRFGLMYRLDVWPPLAIAIGVFLIDLYNYAQHVTSHAVPALWRIHRVHHADTELDATSGLRTHPFELLLLLFVPALILPLAGVPVGSFIVYNIVALPWFMLNHSNMRYPAWFERWASLLMATPDWHRIHHSSHQPETDSHYGCLFSVWDRLFGTTGAADVATIRFGLEKFRDPQEQTVWRLLKMPFREL